MPVRNDRTHGLGQRRDTKAIRMQAWSDGLGAASGQPEMAQLSAGKLLLELQSSRAISQ